MKESIILGIVQGLSEWLPISSDGLIFWVKNNFFGGADFSQTTNLALWLHLGTFLAALIYFRREVKELFLALFKYKKSRPEIQKTLLFLIIATVISGSLGLFLLKLVDSFFSVVGGGQLINIFIASLLFLTAWLQFKNKKAKGLKNVQDLQTLDGVVLGLGQALAVLPGFSRSGLTVSLLLLRRFKEETALKLSFLLSLPIVFLGNIFLNFSSDNFCFSRENFLAILLSFLVGWLTIDLFMKLARRLNFAWFVLLFAYLVIFSSLI